MQDGYVERFDQKISPRPSFPKRGITISPFGKWGTKGDFVNCRSSINIAKDLICHTQKSLNLYQIECIIFYRSEKD